MEESFYESSPKGDVVVVTGGTAGVGRAVVREFAKRGMAVGIMARGEERLRKTEEEAKGLGGNALALRVDVSDAKRVEEAASEIEERLGPIRIWVNNAMVTIFSPLEKISPDEYRRVTEVTYLGYVYGTMAALKRMIPRNKGAIVQVGSALSYRGIPLQSPYCGAKHAIRAFTDSLRSELIHDRRNIYVTMVQLPALNTPQFTWSRVHTGRHPQPVPPIYQPEVAAKAIVWAAFHRRREVWVGAPTAAAITMNKLFPGLVDAYLGVTGYDSQMVDLPFDPDQEGALFRPVPGRFAAHGVFGDRAKEEALQFIFEKIPGLHYLTDPLAAAAMTAKMAPEFLTKYWRYVISGAGDGRPTKRRVLKQRIYANQKWLLWGGGLLAGAALFGMTRRRRA